MTDTSPGPGWWLASDGKWYPQRWEHIFLETATHKHPHDAIAEAGPQVVSLEQAGWEMVNFTVQNHSRSPGDYSLWSVMLAMKRPRTS